MAHVLQSNGDFLVKTRSLTGDPSEAADIILDPETGRNVRITGTLIVEGETISVAAENLTIEDNFIEINVGETGAGVTLQYSGLQVDRGTLPGANLFWDESIQAWTFATGAEGSFNYNNNNVVLSNIKTNVNANAGTLTLIGAGTGKVSVAGTVDYELQVTDDDDIPNKKYVDDQIINAPGHNMLADDTYVYIADSDIGDPGDSTPAPGSIAEFNAVTGEFTDGDASAISLIIDSTLNSQFYSDKTVMLNMVVSEDAFDAILTNKNEGSNLVFKTDTTGKLQTNYALQLDRHVAVPAVVPGSTLIYADAPGAAGTGVYFVNDGASLAGQTGELVARRQALVYSFIF